MKLKFLIFGSVAMLLFSCKSQLNTSKPNEAYLASQVENKPSTVSLSVDLDIPQLERSLNNSLKGSIYEDNKLEDDNLMMKVSKTGDIHFAVNGNKIDCVLPLKVWVKTGFKKELFGLKAESYYEANGALTANVSIAFVLQKDWTLKTQTTINGYQWTQRPTIQAAGVTIPITTVADIAIKSLRGKISSIVDKSIDNKADMHSKLEQTWTELQDPMLVNKDYNMWLDIKPLEIYTTPIIGTGKQLHINLGLSSLIETSVGAKPVVAAKNKLPEYKVVSSIQPDFSIYSKVSITYDKLTEIAKKMVVGQEFAQGSKKVRIDSLTFFGQNDYLVVQVAVSGSAKGIIYCMGKLAYDNNTQMLSVTDFDFELKTRSVLLKSANWLLHKEFLKKIEPMLNISLKDQMGTMISSGNSFLKNYQIQKGVSLNGNLKNVSFNKITITKDAIVVNGEVSGNVKIAVGELF